MAGRVDQISVSHSDAETDAVPDHLRWMDDGATEFRNIVYRHDKAWKRSLRILRRLPELRRARMVVTTEYFHSLAVSFLFALTRAPARHVALGLNISGASLSFRRRWMQRIANLAFSRVDLVTVASRPQARLFHALHGIPLARFAFVHWGFDLPDSSDSRFVAPARPYFCLIGRNNRDHATFCAALEGLDAEGVIIASRPAAGLPPNVSTLANIPFSDCIACIRRSVANVILVNDDDRGAGHITIVTAMHSGAPQIISDVDTATDYFVPGEHALTVPLRDVEATRSAMRELLENPERQARTGRDAQAHAARWLSHAKRTERQATLIRTWLETGRVIAVDPEWAAERGVPAIL